MGRPRRSEERRVVYFAESTFRIWNEKKKELSPDKNRLITINDFAIFLLNQLGQDNFVRNDKEKQTEQEDHRYCAQDTRRVMIHSPIDMEAEISTTPVKLKSTDGGKAPTLSFRPGRQAGNRHAFQFLSTTAYSSLTHI